MDEKNQSSHPNHDLHSKSYRISIIYVFQHRILISTDAVRIYPISRGKFGHYNLLGFSSSVYPFVTKICNFPPLRIVVQTKKNPRSKNSSVEPKNMRTSQIRAKLPRLTVLSQISGVHILPCIVGWVQFSGLRKNCRNVSHPMHF